MLKEQMQAILEDNVPLMTNLSNAAAVLNLLPEINWCGFYLVEKDHLYLGPFQGEAACTIIMKGHGVCGTSLQQKKSIRVDDVNQFPGHIACSAKSKSELVVPIFKGDEVVALIDIDAPIYGRFDDALQKEIEEISVILSKLF